MKEIRLTQGKVALVDDVDFEEISKYKWYPLNSQLNHVCAFTCIKNKVNYMHRMIINAPIGTMVDHINGNPLDNQRANLRLCTNAQNQQNRKTKGKGKSDFRGLSFRKKWNTWEIHVRVNGRQTYIGSSKNEIEAAKLYDIAAIKFHGEYASTNFPRENYQ